MIVDCKLCGIEHRTKGEASEIHAATASVHAWLRRKMEIATQEPPPPPAKKTAPSKKPEIWKNGEKG